MIDDLVYNGRNLRSLGFELKDEQFFTVAKRRKELIDALGADGAELLDNEGYENVEMNYNINSDPYVLWDKSNDEIAHNLIDWLCIGDGTYRVLRDTYNPGYYTYATPINPQLISCFAEGALDTTISFSRKPYWYSDLGTSPRVYTPNVTDATVEINNPEMYSSKPYIKITTAAAFKITVNGDTSHSLTVAGVTQYVEIDSESYDVHAGSTDFNDSTTGNYLPILKPGKNTIRVESLGNKNIEEIEIVPRWRRL